MTSYKNIDDALTILNIIGLPHAQQNERSALCLLALINLTPDKNWSDIEDPLIGITPIMDWVREHYRKDYAPNTRETFRSQTMHQFMAAGLELYNPDNPERQVNSPRAVYQIEPNVLSLLKKFGTEQWELALFDFLAIQPSLVMRYAREREMNRIPVIITPGKEIQLSPGDHSELIRQIIEEFAPRFIPGSILIYAGDTGEKWGYFDENKLFDLGISVDSHGKMPDVILYYPERNWLILVESVTSHGPVNAKRHGELSDLFINTSAGLVFITAFPNRSVMAKYISDISWETEVWAADSPTHLIHFNGIRFLGPYTNKD